ncbi:MAG: lysozyme [Henriciella sp.]|nr:lysozyme [Henriciella sp.]
MALNMRTSQAGLNVIKAFEGFRARSELLPNGRWIIGYGHVRQAKKGLRVSESEAEAILREYDLPPVERFVMRCVLAPTTQNEFDALVSLAFNVGPKAFASSDVVASLNGGNRLEAAQGFDAWRRAKIGGRVQIVDALVRRRAAEKALFLNAPGRMPVASSRLYRAMHDSDALPVPPAPREILVEHNPPPQIEDLLPDEEEDAPETVSLEALFDELQPADRIVETPTETPTATEAAAESVREQMVRILGENGDKVSTPTPSTDGATPEEITAAISELAGDMADGNVQKSVWPGQDDLPMPPAEAPSDDPIEDVDDLLTPLADTEVIDDLEEVEVSQESIERAVEMNESLAPRSDMARFMAALPFGILALIGAALTGFGIASQFGLIRSGRTIENTMAIYMPPFLILLGVILFLAMAFYFVRIIGRDD